MNAASAAQRLPGPTWARERPFQQMFLLTQLRQRKNSGRSRRCFRAATMDAAEKTRLVEDLNTPFGVSPSPMETEELPIGNSCKIGIFHAQGAEGKSTVTC